MDIKLIAKPSWLKRKLRSCCLVVALAGSVLSADVIENFLASANNAGPAGA
jgi:hypothetical protein